jgi:hypothetical protein
VLGYNSDAQAAQQAQQFLEDNFDVRVHCVKAWGPSHSCFFTLPAVQQTARILRTIIGTHACWLHSNDRALHARGNACLSQGDVADLATLQAMFGVLRERYANRCTAFVHNAGLIAGFTSKSDYEKSPALLRSPTQLVTDPLDVQIDT